MEEEEETEKRWEERKREEEKGQRVEDYPDFITFRKWGQSNPR